MRIIAGQYRGRKILPPASDTTRPITDRVKQSLFDILSPLLPESIVYDLFAGTGSMGLESISRGAARVHFFESDGSALALLKQNIQSLDVPAQSEIHPGDLFKYFERQPPVDDPTKRADLIFLDPPYRFLREQPAVLQQLANVLVSHHLKPDATVIFRHDANDNLELPALTLTDRREYGGMTLEILQPT